MSNVRPFLLSLVGAALLAAPVRLARAEDPAPAEADEAPIPWVKVWADAKAQAKKENKDLFIDFTGSDWCGWCKKLEHEVFSKKAFLDVATKKFVFVFLDFPRAEDLRALVADPELNQKLSQDYEVGGYPTIVLATAEGMPYAKTGYEAGGPAAYLPLLDGLQADGAKIKALLAKGKQDKAAFADGFKALEKAELLGYAGYAWVLDQAEASDADGKLGFKDAVAKQREAALLRAEADGLMALVQGRSKETIEWPKLHEQLLKSKRVNGPMLFQFSKHVGLWLLEDQKKPAEAKVVFALPLRDADIAADPGAKAQIDAWLKSCDDALNPKPAEPAKPEAPKAPAPAPK